MRGAIYIIYNEKQIFIEAVKRSEHIPRHFSNDNLTFNQQKLKDKSSVSNYCTRTSRPAPISPFPSPQTSSPSSTSDPPKFASFGTVTTSSPSLYTAVANSGFVDEGSRNRHMSSSNSPTARSRPSVPLITIFVTPG